MKKRLWLLLLSIMGASLLAACSASRGATSSGTSQGNQGESGSTSAIVEVHTNSTNFTQPNVTLHTGESLKLVNDSSVMHVISLGTWKNGVAQPEKEPGAPNVQNQQLTANSSITIGPWKTPGIYHIYCTVHVNMKMTVSVK